LTEPPEPRLSAEERALFDKGVAEFNAGLYFECHESLEDVWMGVRGPTRDFFQGLIQVSVAFHHLAHGNLGGARSTLGRARKRLEPYPDRYYGFDLAAHRNLLGHWLARIEAQDAAALAEAPPTWRFDPPKPAAPT
jgi:predicted metal-dependent hydrolase